MFKELTPVVGNTTKKFIKGNEKGVLFNCQGFNKGTNTRKERFDQGIITDSIKKVSYSLLSQGKGWSTKTIISMQTEKYNLMIKSLEENFPFDFDQSDKVLPIKKIFKEKKDSVYCFKILNEHFLIYSLKKVKELYLYDLFTGKKSVIYEDESRMKIKKMKQKDILFIYKNNYIKFYAVNPNSIKFLNKIVFERIIKMIKIKKEKIYILFINNDLKVYDNPAKNPTKDNFIELKETRNHKFTKIIDKFKIKKNKFFIVNNVQKELKFYLNMNFYQVYKINLDKELIYNNNFLKVQKNYLLISNEYFMKIFNLLTLKELFHYDLLNESIECICLLGNYILWTNNKKQLVLLNFNSNRKRICCVFRSLVKRFLIHNNDAYCLDQKNNFQVVRNVF